MRIRSILLLLTASCSCDENSNYAEGGGWLLPSTVPATRTKDSGLVLSAINLDLGNLEVIDGTGKSGLRSSVAQRPGCKNPVAVEAGDVDEDDIPDLVVMDSVCGPWASVALNDSGLSFEFSYAFTPCPSDGARGGVIRAVSSGQPGARARAA